MIQKIYDMLSILNIPIRYLLRPEIDNINKVGISYHFFSEGYQIHGDGEGHDPGGSLQIDVFSTTDYTDIVNQIKTLMKNNKFRLADMRDSDDSMSNVKYYHKILVFNYLEEEVK